MSLLLLLRSTPASAPPVRTVPIQYPVNQAVQRAAVR